MFAAQYGLVNFVLTALGLIAAPVHWLFDPTMSMTALDGADPCGDSAILRRPRSRHHVRCLPLVNESDITQNLRGVLAMERADAIWTLWCGTGAAWRARC